MLLDFQFPLCIAGRCGQPAIVRLAVFDPFSAARDSAHHGHRDLGAKTCSQAQCVQHRVPAAARQVEVSQLGIGLELAIDVGHGGDDAVFQGLDGQHVLDADAHRVPGVSLGVGNDDLVGPVAKSALQGVDLGRGAAAPGRRIGFVRDEHGLSCDLAPVDAKAFLGLSDHALHHLADMVYVEAGAVVGTVGDLAGQDLADAAHATLANGVLCFQDDRRGAHADDRTVAAFVKGQGCPIQALLGSGCPCGQQARADPFHQVFAGHVVSGDDDHPAAAPGANPVFGDGHGVCGGRAGGVDVRVGAARADVLCELGMAHCQDAKDKPAVKAIVQAVQFILCLVDAAVDLVQHPVLALRQGPELVEHLELSVERLELLVTRDLVGHAVQAWKRRGKDDPCLVGH